MKTMSDRFRAAVVAAEQLPDAIQNELATVLEAEMQWELTLSDPANVAAMAEWIREVDQEIDASYCILE